MIVSERPRLVAVPRLPNGPSHGHLNAFNVQLAENHLSSELRQIYGIIIWIECQQIFVIGCG